MKDRSVHMIKSRFIYLVGKLRRLRLLSGKRSTRRRLYFVTCQTGSTH